MEAVSAFSGVLDSLISKLSFIDQYHKQRKGLRRDIDLLRNELVHMNAAMEKLAGMEKLDVQAKAWRDQVREMAYDIEDHIEMFMHRLGQGDDKDGLFHKFARKIKELREHYQFASKIQELKVRVEELSQSRDRYKIKGTVEESRVVKFDPRLSAMFEDTRRLVGIDGPREEITKLLMEECGTDSGQHLKVVSVVGFGGLGKTTLANQVYIKIKNDFQCTAFVSVSRTPHMPRILKDILSGVGYYGSMETEDDNIQKIIEVVRVKLMNKRYLVVIDDLWSTEDWHIINCAFVENYNCSRVITTTRNQGVARSCCSPGQGNVYQMKPLDEHHSRRLFFERLFYTEDGCPKQLWEISNDMLRKCKGVPLAITSIASLLANQSKNVETWEKIHNSLGFELGTNPTLEWMRHVLSLSYKDLSHELKTCLLYLGMYPEDSHIWKDDLVRKWIAEGFVREEHGLDSEEAAENCFNELINRSMVQPCFDDYTGVLTGCRVHDLMLDLIISKCEEENFITIIDGKFNRNAVLQVRRISHQLKKRATSLSIEEMSQSQVRSYNLFETAHMISLSKFEFLRVLDLHTWNSQFPCLDLSAINHLFLLRYLKVRGFRLELPRKFEKLKHLMTVDMSGSILPSKNHSSDFTSLSYLRHLAFPEIQMGDNRTISLTNGLSKLFNLRSLLRFDIAAHSVECIRDLGELTNLRELGLIWHARLRDDEDNRESILAASLDKLGNSNLRSLYLRYLATSEKFWRNCLTRPRHLHKLHLYCLIPKVPTWMAHAERLAYLYNLEVQELWRDDLQVLAQLPCLVFFCLEAKTIPEKNITIHPDAFPILKHFRFGYELSSCLTFEPGAMPRLQRLKIWLKSGAMQLREGSPVGGIEHLACLEEISINAAGCGDRGQASKIESACRDAISRHTKSEAIKILVDCTPQEYYRRFRQ